MERRFKPCPFCGCHDIYEIDRDDKFIGFYPQLFCNGCKIKFEVENDSVYHEDRATYFYLQDKLYKTWNTREVE